MSTCIACGRVESFDDGSNSPEGWFCSRCGTVGTLTSAIQNAPSSPVNGYDGLFLVGLIANLNLSTEELNAITGAFGSSGRDQSLEDIWGLGIPARHQTSSQNIVVVFTRNHGVMNVYGIGRHVSKGNSHYRILRWNGGHVRVNR